jgi:hypothetical protein
MIHVYKLLLFDSGTKYKEDCYKEKKGKCWMMANNIDINYSDVHQLFFVIF